MEASITPAYALEAEISGLAGSNAHYGHLGEGFILGGGAMATLGARRNLGSIQVGLTTRYRFVGFISDISGHNNSGAKPLLHVLDAFASIEFLTRGSGPRLGLGWSWNWPTHELERIPSGAYNGFNGLVADIGYVEVVSEEYKLAVTFGASLALYPAFVSPMFYADLGLRKTFEF